MSMPITDRGCTFENNKKSRRIKRCDRMPIIYLSAGHVAGFRYLNYTRFVQCVVHEANITTLRYLNLKVEISLATDICFDNKMVTLKNGVKVQYDKLCICTGARPRRLLQSQHVTVLRDTDSVATLASKLRTARSIIIVGNGGIAMELA